MSDINSSTVFNNKILLIQVIILIDNTILNNSKYKRLVRYEITNNKEDKFYV
jgi:predicted secreted acid phosphatase